jgi:hypothetical protein
LILGKNEIKITGFLDSGNRAKYRDRPVCFLSKKRILDLIEVGQGCDEMEITTVGGEKKIKIFQIEKLVIYSSKGWNIIEKVVENVYVSPCEPFQGDEYELLLNGACYEIF